MSGEAFNNLVSICKKNEFAGAYYYHDAHMYSSLACLFGMDDIKVEGEREVIEVSDNTAIIMSEDTMPVDLRRMMTKLTPSRYSGGQMSRRNCSMRMRC